MYRDVERAPEKSKHITSSRHVPDGKHGDVNKHHFHSVTFSRCLLGQIVLTTVTLLAHVSEYSFDSAANKSEKSGEAAVLLQIKRKSKNSVHLMHWRCTAVLCYAAISLKNHRAHEPTRFVVHVQSSRLVKTGFFCKIMTLDTHAGEEVWFWFSRQQ